jgi:hypothetical protein
MRRIILLSLVITAYAVITNAQSTRYFERILGRPAPIGENTNVVLQLVNGSYITFGELGNSNNSDVYADYIKTDAYGNTLLDSFYYDSLYSSLWFDAQLLNDDNIIIAGEHRLGYSATDENMWILEADTNGHILWSSFVGDTAHPTIAYCVRKTFDNGYILGGITDELPEKGCIIKTDSQGNKIWERLIGGTTYDNGIYGVVLLPDSSFVFTGTATVIYGY